MFDLCRIVLMLIVCLVWKLGLFILKVLVFVCGLLVNSFFVVGVCFVCEMLMFRC